MILIGSFIVCSRFWHSNAQNDKTNLLLVEIRVKIGPVDRENCRTKGRKGGTGRH